MTKLTINEPPKTPPPDADVVVDSKGRRLRVREPDVLQESRLVRAMGAEASQNNAYMLGYVMPAAMVVQIDGEDMPFPMTEREVDASIKRLGREGLTAVMTHLTEKSKTVEGTEEIKK